MSGRKLVQFVLVLLAISWVPVLGSVVSAGPAEAHQDGCHRWHSCPSDSGSYVCGDLGLVARYRQSLAAHERENARWRQRREELVSLLKLARDASADQMSDYANIKLKRGESVYCTVPGALVDMRSRSGTLYPTVVDQGLLTVTSMRVAFNGSKNRDWSYDKLEAMRHIDQDRTMMTVSNRKNASGFIYTDAERTRLYLDLALADRSGSRAGVIDAIGQRLHQHETARPTPPSPPGPPPAALDLSTDAPARGPIPTASTS